MTFVRQKRRRGQNFLRNYSITTTIPYAIRRFHNGPIQNPCVIDYLFNLVLVLDAFIPISRNYSFDQTKSVHDEVARYIYKYIFYNTCSYARTSDDLTISYTSYYVVAGATARYDRCGKWLSSSPLGTIVV